MVFQKLRMFKADSHAIKYEVEMAQHQNCVTGRSLQVCVTSEGFFRVQSFPSQHVYM